HTLHTAEGGARVGEGRRAGESGRLECTGGNQGGRGDGGAREFELGECFVGDLSGGARREDEEGGWNQQECAAEGAFHGALRKHGVDEAVKQAPGGGTIEPRQRGVKRSGNASLAAARLRQDTVAARGVK